MSLAEIERRLERESGDRLAHLQVETAEKIFEFHPKRAMELLDTALATLAPDDPHHTRARALAIRQDHEAGAEDVQALIDTAPAAARPYALVAQGLKLTVAGELVRALEVLAEALRTKTDRFTTAEIHFRRGNVLREQGSFAEATEELEVARALWAVCDPPWHEGRALAASAVCLFDDERSALELLMQSLDIVGEAGPSHIYANSLLNTGLAHLMFEAPADAIPYMEESLAISRELGNRVSEARTIVSLSQAYSHLGDGERASEFGRQALDRFEMFSVPDRFKAYTDLTQVFREAGDIERALTCAEASARLADKLDSPRARAASRSEMGRALLALGRGEEALEAIQLSVKIATEAGDEHALFRVSRTLADAYALVGDHQKALEGYQRFLELQREDYQRKSTAQMAALRTRHELARAQRHAENVERRALGRYRAIVENTPGVTIQMFDLEGHVLDWNQASEQVFGWSRDEALGNKLDELIFTEEQQRSFTGILRRIERTGEIPAPSEWTIRTKDGTPRTIYSTHFPIADDGGTKQFVSMDVDITEQRAAEERFRNAFRGNPHASAVIDFETRFLDVNPEFTRIFGYSRDEVVGKRDRDLGIMPESLGRELYERVLSDGSVRSVECRLRNKSGREVIGELSMLVTDVGGQRGVLAWMRDVTEQRRAEQRLRASEARYRSLVEDQTEFIVRHTPDGVRTFVNEAYCRYYGLPREELLGKSFLPLISDEDRQAVFDKLAALTPEEPVLEEEHRTVDGDGNVRWHHWISRAVFDDDETLVEVQAVGRDITKRRLAESELRRLKDQLEAENVYLQDEIRREHDFAGIVGSSMPMHELRTTIELVAKTDATVLVCGETGTGKELVARALHDASPRRDRPLVKVNCAAVAAGLVESELFGHEKGAFTGAHDQRQGRFELADGGSIFLDEVGELSPDVQVKLLRVLQEQEFERVGSSKPVRVDVRVIAATNRDLAVEVEAGRFRSDLFYRLNVFPIEVPPLRYRRSDIAELAGRFLADAGRRLGKEFRGIHPDTLRWMEENDWPGNVRELMNFVERAAILSPVPWLVHVAASDPRGGSLGDETLDSVARAHICGVLERTGWKIEGPNGAARILGLNPSTMRSRMKKLGISR